MRQVSRVQNRPREWVQRGWEVTVSYNRRPVPWAFVGPAFVGPRLCLGEAGCCLADESEVCVPLCTGAAHGQC